MRFQVSPRNNSETAARRNLDATVTLHYGTHVRGRHVGVHLGLPFPLQPRVPVYHNRSMTTPTTPATETLTADDDMPTLEDEFGCDPWDDEHYDWHPATADSRGVYDKLPTRGSRW